MATQRKNGLDVDPVGLTPIHAPIQCPATDEVAPNSPELDDIAVQHFLDTLAEVALAVTKRRREAD